MIAKSQAINTQIDQGNFQQALELRGRSFVDSLELLKTLARAEPKEEIADAGRIAILTGGPDAPGMNAILRTVLRVAMNEGQDVVGVALRVRRAGARRHLGPATGWTSRSGSAWAAANWARSATS